MNYSFFTSIKSKSCIPVSVEELLEKLKTPFIKTTCENILKLLEEGKEEDATRLKTSLPVIVLGQLYENGQTRSKGGGKPTGLLMIDYDDCKTIEEAKQLMAHIKEKWLSDIMLRDLIVAAHFSPRMHGVHIWYRWIDGCHSYEECNERIAALLERPGYDQSCKDNSRCSFLVPIDYFHISNWDAMANNEEYAKMQGEQEKAPSLLPQGGVIDKRSESLVGGGGKDKRGESPVGEQKGAFPQDYDGIPYADIVKCLTLKCAPRGKMDENGYVMHGARNNTWFKVCCLLRYICDNDVDWLCAIAPDWALDHEKSQPGKLREAATNACKRGHSFSTPKTLQVALRECGLTDDYEERHREDDTEKRQAYAVAEMEGIEQSKQKFLMFPKELPPIFKEWCDGMKPEWKAAGVLCLLTNLGTICSKLRANYLDGRLHSPSFQAVIEAQMASGKQIFSDISQFVLTPITEMDLEGNTKLNVFNAEVVKANGAKTISNPPDVCVRTMSGRFTEAGFNGALDTSKGLHIVSCASEIDQVSQAWKEMSYILRDAYDNGMYSRTLQSPRQFRGPRRLFLNTFLCGTPRAVARLYNDPEDGLVSRTMFFKLVVETPGMPRCMVTEKQKEAMLKLIRKLHDQYCVVKQDENYVVALEQKISLDYVNRHMEKWLEQKSKEAAEYGSEAIERFRRRDAVNGFRAGMVAHAIYLATGKKITNRERTVVKHFAEWVADYSLMMHDYKFGKVLNDIIASDQINESISKVAVLDQLPDTFSLADAYKVFSRETPSGVRCKLARLVQKGMLSKEERGIYTKIIN